MKHEVGTVALEGELLPSIQQDGRAFGLVLVVVGDVELVGRSVVGMEVVGAVFELEHDLVARSGLPLAGFERLLESAAEVGIGLCVGFDAIVGKVVHPLACPCGRCRDEQYQGQQAEAQRFVLHVSHGWYQVGL